MTAVASSGTLGAALDLRSRRVPNWLTLGISSLGIVLSATHVSHVSVPAALAGFGVGLLLIAVCANVAGLLIARAGERRKEFGIRAAIGASRGRILRQLVGEALALAIPGAVLGGFLSWTLAPFVIGLMPPVRDLANYAFGTVSRTTGAFTGTLVRPVVGTRGTEAATETVFL